MFKRLFVIFAICASTFTGMNNAYAAVGISKYDLTFSDPLVNAADHGNDAEIGRLLKTGHSINAKDEFGVTALMRAVYRGNAPLVKELLNRGADVHQRDIGGASPLHVASRMGQNKIVAMLIEYGASPEIEDNEGFSAAGRAIKSGHKETVKTIFKDEQVYYAPIENRKALLKLASESKDQDIQTIVVEKIVIPEHKELELTSLAPTQIEAIKNVVSPAEDEIKPLEVLKPIKKSPKMVLVQTDGVEDLQPIIKKIVKTPLIIEKEIQVETTLIKEGSLPQKNEVKEIAHYEVEYEDDLNDKKSDAQELSEMPKEISVEANNEASKSSFMSFLSEGFEANDDFTEQSEESRPIIPQADAETLDSAPVDLTGSYMNKQQSEEASIEAKASSSLSPEDELKLAKEALVMDLRKKIPNKAVNTINLAADDNLAADENKEAAAGKPSTNSNSKPKDLSTVLKKLNKVGQSNSNVPMESMLNKKSAGQASSSSIKIAKEHKATIKKPLSNVSVAEAIEMEDDESCTGK